MRTNVCQFFLLTTNYKFCFHTRNPYVPIPLAARSKVWVCGRSLVGIAGSNPAGGKDVCCECCVLSGRGLCDGLITVQSSPTDCGVSEYDHESSIMRRP
jgi:hypothetical protein